MKRRQENKERKQRKRKFGVKRKQKRGGKRAKEVIKIGEGKTKKRKGRKQNHGREEDR